MNAPRRRARILLSTAVACFAVVGSPSTAEGPEPLGTEGPEPAGDPLPPEQAGQLPLTENQRLRQRLQARLEAIDRRIAELLSAGGDEAPLPAATGDDEELAADRRRRDRAWRELERVLRARARQDRTAAADPLDEPPPVEVDAEVAALRAGNRLRALLCYRDLRMAGRLDAAGLARAAELAADLPCEDLSEDEQARAIYLRFWFALERARGASSAERESLLAAADAQLERLEQEHPDRLITASARDLRKRFAAAPPSDVDGGPSG